jgi:hypothetical protein
MNYLSETNRKEEYFFFQDSGRITRPYFYDEIERHTRLENVRDERFLLLPNSRHFIKTAVIF